MKCLQTMSRRQNETWKIGQIFEPAGPFSLVVTKRLSFFLLVGLILGDDIMGRTFQIATLLETCSQSLRSMERRKRPNFMVTISKTDNNNYEEGSQGSIARIWNRNREEGLKFSTITASPPSCRFRSNLGLSRLSRWLPSRTPVHFAQIGCTTANNLGNCKRKRRHFAICRPISFKLNW